jgi:hypothetical protein
VRCIPLAIFCNQSDRDGFWSSEASSLNIRLDDPEIEDGFLEQITLKQ